MTTDIKELVKRLRAWNRDVLGADGTFGVAADAIEALAGEVERLKRMLFPYAEDKEISGVTWNGFYLIGNRKSVDEFNRLENRAAQLEVYRAEFVRRNEAAEAEVERLKGVLGIFAAIKADDGDTFDTWNDDVIIRCEVTVGDLKKARAALEVSR